VVPLAALDPPIELELLPACEPVARGIAFVPLASGTSTAVPVPVVPGCVTPVPVEFICGAFGLAPLCANAAGELMMSAAAVAKMIFFMCRFLCSWIPLLSKRDQFKHVPIFSKWILRNAESGAIVAVFLRPALRFAAGLCREQN
jgi:hypothetical protein